MSNEEFSYFFHGTTISDPSLVNEIFNNGLINYRGNDMLSTMWPMQISAGELGQKMKEYAGTKGNAVFVIKIPKYYLTPRTTNGQLQQIPLPIWKHLSSSGDHGDISQLSPELVYGVYFAENDSFMQNPNYSPVHNPTGLQFDNQQIEFLLNNCVMGMYNFAVGRKDKSFEELTQADDIAHNWDNALSQYSDHFGIEQNKNHHSL